MNGKERVLAMLEGRAVDHLPLMPITMMFAADLAGVSYRDYASDHEVLARSQMAVAEAFGFDHVSAISDPAREVSDLGGTIEWFDNQPPAIVESRALLQDKARLKSLKLPDMAEPGRMRDRIRAVRLLRQVAGRTRVVEGWVEGPCAMAADLRGLNALMLDFYEDPDFVNELLQFVTTMEAAFARAQIEAGADVIGVGDAAASLIGPKLYASFVLPRQKELVAAIQAAGARVRLHICGSTRKILRGMGSLGCDLVDLDSLRPWLRLARPCGRRRCSSAISTRSASSAMASRNASPPRSRIATRRPALATSWVRAARCRAVRRPRISMP